MATVPDSSPAKVPENTAPSDHDRKRKRRRQVLPRIRDFVAKVFGISVNFGAIDSAFHNDLLHVLAMSSRKKPRIRLSAERLSALDCAIKGAKGFKVNSVEELKAFVQKRKAKQLLEFNAAEYYDSQRSSQYTQHNALAQRRLTWRTLDLLYRCNPNHNPNPNVNVAGRENVYEKGLSNEVVLDIGCGSGLSAEFARAYEGQRGRVGFVIGLDRSPHMLALCDQREMDCVLYDLAQPLPFRENSVNCVISVSAVHYVCHGKKEEENESRASAFMKSLSIAMQENAAVSMQFFPESPRIAECLARAAKCNGMSSLTLLLDYTHHTKAYRWFLTSWPATRRCILAEALVGEIQTPLACVLCLESFQAFPNKSHLEWAINDHCKRARQAMRKYKRDPKLIEHATLVPLAERLIREFGEAASLDNLKDAYHSKLHHILHSPLS